VLAATYRVNAGQLTLTSEFVTEGNVPEALPLILGHTSASLSASYVNASWGDVRALDSASATYRRYHPGRRFSDWDAMAPLLELGVADQVAAKAIDPSGVGCIFLASSETEVPIRDRDALKWNRVMAHVLAALRLREALEHQVEAVIDPSGRVVHAETAAQPRSVRDALRGAAIRIDRARGAAGKADARAALASWRALVCGRWSLVDSFESDGRRYLVARRNDPRLPLPRELTERERQVAAYAALGHSNKHIAYTLGLAPSTVSTHLAAAMQRLGARTRADLARIWLLETAGS
jgi:DNA-binding NarL/FixJ family response regulator